MAIAPSGTAASQKVVHTSSTDNSFSVDSGASPTQLTVKVMNRGSTTAVSGITYNGVSLTYITSVSNGSIRAEIWHLESPASGSNTLTVTMAATGAYYTTVHAAAWSGTETTSSLDQKNEATGNSTTPSVSVTPTTNNQLVVGAVIHEDNVALTTGSGETAILNIDDGNWVTSSSYAVQTTATTQDVNWSAGAAQIWAAVAATFKEAAGASPVTVAVNPATLNLNPQPIAIPVIVPVGTATLTLSPQPVTIPVIVPVNPATLSLSPQAVTPVSGTPAVTVAVNPATLSLNPQVVTPTPGTPPITVAVNPATLNLTPQAVTVINSPTPPVTIAVNPATLTLWEQPVAIVRGTPAATPVTVQVNPATLRLIGQPVNVTAPGSAILIGESSPLSLSVTTVNNLEHGLGTHTHAIEASAAPGVTESLLKTDTLGELHLASFQADEINSHLISRATDTFDLGSPTRLWRRGYLSELDTVLFAENTVTLLGGWFAVSKDAGTLAEDVTAVQTTIDFGKTMTPNDFVILRASLAVEHMQIGTLVSGTTYNVTRDVDGSGANTWPQGQPFMVTGNTGDGRIEISAYDTPRIQILEQGATYNAQTELIRLGDLNGNWGYSTEEHGIALGEYAASRSNLTWDPTNGLRLRTYDLTVLQLDNAGNASIEGFLNIGSAGGIYQGTGTPASPTTGIKLWNDGGIGRLAGYNAGTLQAEFASDGKIKAGGGTVTLDANGVKIQSTSTWPTPGEQYTLDLGGGTVYGYSALDGSGVVQEVSGKTVRLINASTEMYMEIKGFRVVADSGVMSASSIAGYNPGAGNIGYTGNLKSRKNSTYYDVYGFHPLTTKLTSTSWDGDAKSGSGTIDLNTVFGVPLNVKAVSIRLIIIDGTVGTKFSIGYTSSNAYYVQATTQVANVRNESDGIVPVSSGRYIYYVASAAVDQVWLQITGYWI